MTLKIRTRSPKFDITFPTSQQCIYAMLSELIIRHSYHFPIVSSPEGQSWKIDDDGSFNFEWTGGKIVLQELTFSICGSIYFSIIRIGKYVKKVYM